jgi:hypothetical protein
MFRSGPHSLIYDAPTKIELYNKDPLCAQIASGSEGEVESGSCESRPLCAKHAFPGSLYSKKPTEKEDVECGREGIIIW